MNCILITDSLFIADEHVTRLKDNGLNIVRIDEVAASEATLCDAIKDCEGYILGGIERVTERVIDAAPALKVISFTGANYAHFIPAHRHATQKGIAITNCPGANANAVAEFSLALILMMVRQLSQLTAQGGKGFYIAPEFSELTVGVIGFGAVGRLVADKLQALGFTIIVNTRTAQAAVTAAGFENASLKDIAARSEVVTLHVDKLHGMNILDAELIGRLKSDAIIINTCFPEALDQAALIERIKAGELTAAADDPIIEAQALPAGRYVVTNAHTAYNTRTANKVASDMATQSIINLLNDQDDPYIVNAEFKAYRSPPR